MPPAASSSSSRKRAPRDSPASEERREARAERNRLAAQISRDRRKAEYSRLEARVAELEQENFLLRSRALPPLGGSLFGGTSTQRENDELRERVRVLERGWEAVTRALAAQGLNSVPALPSSPSASALSPAPSLSSSTSSIVLSPAPGVPSPSSPARPTLTVPSQQSHLSTRHPAAGGHDSDAVLPTPSSLFGSSAVPSPLSPLPPSSSSASAHPDWFTPGPVFSTHAASASHVAQPPMASSTGALNGGVWDEDRQRASALELERLLSSVVAVKDDPVAQPWNSWSWLQSGEVAL